jgi:oligopeptide transport system permease protein
MGLRGQSISTSEALVATRGEQLMSRLKSHSLWNESMKRLKKNKGAVYSAYFVVFVVIIAVLAPVIAPYPFDQQNVSAILQGPSAKYLLGTDSLGRDILSRLIYGARISMAVGIFTSVVSLLMGTVYGAISGWFGGKVDAVLMRVVDILYSIPALVLLVLAKVTIESSGYFEDPQARALFSIFGALSIYGWMSMARIVRGQVMQAKEMLYIEAAHALGIGEKAIVMRHIIPNILGPIIVTLTFQIPSNVMFESFLSFIGLGLQPPYSSWGVLANEGWRSLRTFPHLIISPGIAIFLTMLAFNLFGDGLRDAFDPKMK